METPDTHSELLISTPTRGDALEIVYALKLRQITASADPRTPSTRASEHAVFVSPPDVDRAREVLPRILDAMLPAMADNGNGGCHFCGYDLTGTSAHSNLCPECGEDIRAFKARFEARDRQDHG